MSIDPKSLPYRPCVGIALFSAAGLVFVGRRIDQKAESWQLPQGGIDPGEKPRETAFRELGEEIGTAKAEILEELDEWLTYDLPPHLIGKVWGGKYRGQTQKWFAMRFLGQDTDINLKTQHPEFNAWRWQRLSELAALGVDFKREIYETLTVRFAKYAAP